MSEWRPAPGFKENYRVSDQGEVWSRPRQGTPGGILRPRVGKRGYLVVTLTTGGRQLTFAVHRLVALAFLGPRPAGQEVRHLDGDRLNPRLSNLAYGTPTENQLDKRRHGTDHNVAKTHCSKGHPFNEVNTYVLPSRPNTRYCRACSRASSLRRYHAKRAAA